jgi:serpin B
MHAGPVHGTAAIGDGWVAGTKAYLGGDSEMLILVPDSGRFTEIEDDLPEVLADVDAALAQTDYALTLPTFTAASLTDLREVMERRLGVEGLFGVVGFDGIGETLYLDSAAHGVKVIVDEAGTEAAAASVLGIAAGSAPSEPEITVAADKPFIYVIRDVDTGAITFVGRVLDPS